MKAKVIRKLTGKVLVEFADGTLTDIFETTSFFKVAKDIVEKDWDSYWQCVEGGEICKITPRTDGCYYFQVRNEFIKWGE